MKKRKRGLKRGTSPLLPETAPNIEFLKESAMRYRNEIEARKHQIFSTREKKKKKKRNKEKDKEKKREREKKKRKKG